MKKNKKIKDTLLRSYEKRAHLFEDRQTTCFRLFNSDTDGIKGLTIDRYGEYLLVQFFEKALFDDESGILSVITSSAGSLPVSVDGILLKNRAKAPVGNRELFELRKSRFVEGQLPPEDYTVLQNGIAASVDLLYGQNTGVFLDMRSVRDRLPDYYHIFDRMLNLFCYTALFSVHALKNGVTHAVNVDLSKAFLKRAGRNYELNNIHYDNRDFLRDDAFHWIKRFTKMNKEFSYIVLDPPTFSKNKKEYFSVKKNFPRYIEGISKIAPEGYLLSAINSPSITEHEYRSLHPVSWEMMFFENESPDCRNIAEPYLKVGLWKIG